MLASTSIDRLQTGRTGLLVLPSVQIDGKRLQRRMGVGGTDSSGQFGLDEIQHLAIIRATGKQRSLQTPFAWAFFQVPDVEVKLSFYGVITFVHRIICSVCMFCAFCLCKYGIHRNLQQIPNNIGSDKMPMTKQTIGSKIDGTPPSLIVRTPRVPGFHKKPLCMMNHPHGKGFGHGRPLTSERRQWVSDTSPSA